MGKTPARILSRSCYTKDMNRLSLLIWLAIAVAVLPLLAIPIWLMKTAIISTALVIAGTTYSLMHQFELTKSSAKETSSRHISAGFHSQTVSAEADETTEVKDESGTDTEDPSADTESKRSASEATGETEVLDEQERDDTPINVTDPNSDRFIAVNTYKSRSDRLRS